MSHEARYGNLSRRNLLKVAGAASMATVLPSLTAGPGFAQEAVKEAVIMYPGKPYAIWSGIRFWTNSGALSRMLFEPLMDIDENLQPTPALAESWEVLTPSLTRYTLRSGATWSDGAPITSDDVVFSMNVTFAPELTTLMAPEIATIAGAEERQSGAAASLSGVRAIDELTFEIETSEPDTSILRTLALRWWSPIPKHIYGEIPMADFLAAPEMQVPPVVSGPFKIDGTQTDQWYDMSRNESYWREGRPLLDKLTLVFGNIGDPVALASQQRYDFFLARQPDVASALAADPNFTTTFVEYIQPYRINVNCSLPEFADPRVRKAMAYAIDRETLTAQIWQGNANPQSTDFQGDLLDPDAEVYGYDPERARQLLTEAGWDPNTVVYFERAAPAAGAPVDPVLQAEFVAYQTWFGEIGITLEERLHPDSATYAEFTLPTTGVAKYGLYENPHRRYDSYGPLEMKTYLASQPRNYAFWTNENVDALVTEAVAAESQEAYAEIGRQLSVIVAEECPYIPTKAVQWGIVASKRFSNYSTIGEAYFVYAWPYEWDVTA